MRPWTITEGGPLGVFASIQRTHVTDGVGTRFTPPHSRTLHSLAYHRLARTLHRARTDVPACRLVRRVVHPVYLIAEVPQHLRPDRPANPFRPVPPTPPTSRSSLPRLHPVASATTLSSAPAPLPHRSGATPSPTSPGTPPRERSPESPPPHAGSSPARNPPGPLRRPSRATPPRRSRPTGAPWRRNSGPISASGYSPLMYRAPIDAPGLGPPSNTRSRSGNGLKTIPTYAIRPSALSPLFSLLSHAGRVDPDVAHRAAPASRNHSHAALPPNVRPFCMCSAIRLPVASVVRSTVDSPSRIPAASFSNSVPFSKLSATAPHRVASRSTAGESLRLRQSGTPVPGAGPSGTEWQYGSCSPLLVQFLNRGDESLDV